MKRLLLIPVLFLSCTKKEITPEPVPDPAPVVNHYFAKASVKSVVYDVSMSNPYTTDSTYFVFRVNGKEKKEQYQYQSASYNYNFSDSVKTGDTVYISVSAKTDSPNIKHAIIRLNKFWLTKDSVETTIHAGITDTVPVNYSDGIGHSNRSWQFIIN